MCRGGGGELSRRHFMQRWAQYRTESMDLTEVEDIKILRRGGKNTQKNYTMKIFMTQITTMV